MTDPREDHLAPLPDDASDAESAANQQFAHALLQTLEEEESADQERIRQLMQAIEADERPYEGNRTFSMPWGITSGIAAAVLLVVALIFLNGTRQSATATVYDALEAMRLAGDRTYTVSVARTPDSAFKRAPESRLDIRADDQYVFRTRTPEGHMLVAGVDADGDWMLRRDGTVSRSTPRHHRPRWVDLAGGSLLLASIDGLLAALPTTYELELLEPEPLSPESTIICDRVRATPLARTDHPGLDERIDLWIDPSTRLVRQIDLVLGTPRDRRPPVGMPPPPKRAPNIGGENGRLPPPGGPHRRRPHSVRFELERQEPLPPNWFNPEAHSQERPPT